MVIDIISFSVKGVEMPWFDYVRVGAHRVYHNLPSVRQVAYGVAGVAWGLSVQVAHAQVELNQDVGNSTVGPDDNGINIPSVFVVSFLGALGVGATLLYAGCRIRNCVVEAREQQRINNRQILTINQDDIDRQWVDSPTPSTASSPPPEQNLGGEVAVDIEAVDGEDVRTPLLGSRLEQII